MGSINYVIISGGKESLLEFKEVLQSNKSERGSAKKAERAIGFHNWLSEIRVIHLNENDYGIHLYYFNESADSQKSFFCFLSERYPLLFEHVFVGDEFGIPDDPAKHGIEIYENGKCLLKHTDLVLEGLWKCSWEEYTFPFLEEYYLKFQAKKFLSTPETQSQLLRSKLSPETITNLAKFSETYGTDIEAAEHFDKVMPKKEFGRIFRIELVEILKTTFTMMFLRPNHLFRAISISSFIDEYELIPATQSIQGIINNFLVSGEQALLKFSNTIIAMKSEYKEKCGEIMELSFECDSFIEIFKTLSDKFNIGKNTLLRISILIELVKKETEITTEILDASMLLQNIKDRQVIKNLLLNNFNKQKIATTIMNKYAAEVPFGNLSFLSRASGIFVNFELAIGLNKIAFPMDEELTVLIGIDDSGRYNEGGDLPF